MPILAALMLLTRIPVPFQAAFPDGVFTRATAWYGLVGTLVGLAGGGVYALAVHVHLPPYPAALLTMITLVWLTGAMHEDGLADVADGFGGGRDTARKLEIMRDSRVGSYGVLAVVFSITLRASALATMGNPWLVLSALAATGALSRAVMPLVMAALPSARPGGLADVQGRPDRSTVFFGLSVGVAVVLLALGPKAGPALGAAALAALAVSGLARRQIGGHTGDVLGAVQQAVETVMLLTLAALR